MLKSYLRIIQNEEGLRGQVDPDTERYILLKYFDNYEFEDEEEVVKFYIAWRVLELPLLRAKPILENCALALGERYNLNIKLNGLVLSVKERGKCYSWNEKEGWHEGYDAFMGDINKCYGDNQEEAIKSLFVKDTAHDWPVEKPDKVGLITESCGYGKTHWVEHELVDELNNLSFVWNRLAISAKVYQKKDILFVSTRRSIKDQQLRYGEVEGAVEEDFTELGANPIYDERKDKVRIITTAKLGSLYLAGKVEKMFPVVVIDELHSLFLDTMFSEESYAAIECLHHFWKDIIKIGLTATPELLVRYIDPEGKMFYSLDDNELLPKYNSEEFVYCNYTYLKSSLKLVKPAIDYKVIVYCASAKNAIALSEKYENAAYLISQYNKDEEAVKKQKPLYDYIIDNAKLPDNVYLLFMTSAYREGVELKDETVRAIIIDASDEITISQFIGRIRANLEKVIVNTNENQKERILKVIEDYEAIENYKETELAELYGVQKEKVEKQENVTLLVQKIDGRYELNKYLVPVQKYLLDCYIQANNRGNNQVVKVGNRDLVSSKDWFNRYLGDYSRTPIRGAVGSDDVAKEVANWKAVDKYLNRRLTKSDKDELAVEIGLVDTKTNRLVKWTTLKKELAARGYKIEDKSTGTVRYTILTKM